MNLVKLFYKVTFVKQQHDVCGCVPVITYMGRIRTNPLTIFIFTTLLITAILWKGSDWEMVSASFKQIFLLQKERRTVETPNISPQVLLSNKTMKEYVYEKEVSF